MANKSLRRATPLFGRSFYTLTLAVYVPLITNARDAWIVTVGSGLPSRVGDPYFDNDGKHHWRADITVNGICRVGKKSSYTFRIRLQ